jgi:amino acid transporter
VATPAPAGGSGELRRSISLPWLVLYGLGTTIGAGVYALTGVVAGRAGMAAPFAFGVASLLALFTALSFAELSSRFPRAGGEAVYVLEGFGSVGLSRLVGLLVVLAGLVSAATLCTGMVGYLSALLAVPEAAAIVVVVVAVGAVAAWGVQESVVAAGLMTLVEVGGLLAVIVAGGGHVDALPARVAELVPADASAWRAVGGAAVLGCYAFLGFEDMVNVAEEVRDVRRVMPRAIVATLAITVLLYMLLASVAVLSVPPEELAAAPAPLSLVFERGGGSAELLAVIAIVALSNGALVQVIKASRVLYGLAREGALPTLFGQVYPRTGTPLVATAVSMAAVAGFALALPIASLAELTSVVTLVTFTLANAALLVVKRKDPAPTGATLYPSWVPATGCVASLSFVVFEAVRLF